MNTNNILFSIIIPHYNLGQKIIKLLNSLATEIDDSFEVIIVDDKSSQTYLKEVHEVITKFNSLNIQIVKNESFKKGAGVCRNIGMDHAKGKWYIFADSDDHFLPNSGKIIRDSVNTNADLILFQPTSTDEFGEICDRHKTFLKGFSEFYDTGSDLILRYQFPVVWSKIFRASVVKKYSICFDDVLASNDVMFSTKFGYHATEILVSNHSIYSWDFNTGSITSTVSKARFEDIKQVLINHNNFIREKLTDTEYKSVRNSAVKTFLMAMTRYKFGLTYSIKTFVDLILKGFIPIRHDEIQWNLVRRFFKNNQLYKRARAK